MGKEKGRGEKDNIFFVFMRLARVALSYSAKKTRRRV